MNITIQLVEIYLEKETWHKTKLSYEKAKKYFDKLIKDQRVITCIEGNKVVGYIESWRLDLAQYGCLISGGPFSAYKENVTDGEICYVADIYIDEDYRNTDVIKRLKNEFFEQNKDCKFITGEEVKRDRRLRVFRRG